jgi:hypothetical protein
MLLTSVALDHRSLRRCDPHEYPHSVCLSPLLHFRLLLTSIEGWKIKLHGRLDACDIVSGCRTCM